MRFAKPKYFIPYALLILIIQISTFNIVVTDARTLFEETMFNVIALTIMFLYSKYLMGFLSRKYLEITDSISSTTIKIEKFYMQGYIIFYIWTCLYTAVTIGRLNNLEDNLIAGLLTSVYFSFSFLLGYYLSQTEGINSKLIKLISLVMYLVFFIVGLIS